MKANNYNIKKIEKVVRENYFVKDRVEILTDLGYNVEIRAMGSGGLLQRKDMKNGIVRIQISYGWGRYNYAYCVELF